VKTGAKFAVHTFRADPLMLTLAAGLPDPPATDRTFPERRSVAWTCPADHQPAKGATT